MKKAAAKYIISLFTAVYLLVTPIFASSLSGTELLERFDRLFAAESFIRTEASEFEDETFQHYSYEHGEEHESEIIVIIIEEEVSAQTEDEQEENSHNESESAELEENTPAAEEYVFASTVPLEGFGVTSGINRRSESTFDAARTIIGTAPRGTLIRIDVYGYDESTDTFYQVSGTSLTVGASGSFSSAQQLKLGRNFIRIKATFHDENSDILYVSAETAQLNRLADEVRTQLERGLLLP